MDIANMIDKLDEYLPEKRKIHSINVSKSAVRLAKILGCDEKKAEIAGILHDTASVKYEDVPKYCTKYSIVLDDMEQKSTALSHSVVGSYIARHEFGIEDEEILSAIRYHTTGRPGMTDLEKSVYLADLIEVGRNYPMVDELRELAYSGKVDEAVLR
ncbi:MAG: bis(5'-nucleosyl)-tetraphosphatase (symmetrical) YqeK, partial [Peptostreptococcus anaerobius]